MPKLEELKDDVKICVFYNSEDEFQVMTVDEVKNYLHDENIDPANVYLALAEVNYPSIDPEHITDYLVDEMYEDWDEDVLHDPDFQEAVKKINEILHKYPSYEEGNKVEFNEGNM